MPAVMTPATPLVLRRIPALSEGRPPVQPPNRVAAATITAEGAADVHRPRRFRPLGGEHESWMWMSGLIALCGLAVVALLVLPAFGSRVAAMTAVTVVVAVVLACYLVCIPRAFARTVHPGAPGGGPERDH